MSNKIIIVLMIICAVILTSGCVGTSGRSGGGDYDNYDYGGGDGGGGGDGCSINNGFEPIHFLSFSMIWILLSKIGLFINRKLKIIYAN